MKYNILNAKTTVMRTSFIAILLSMFVAYLPVSAETAVWDGTLVRLSHGSGSEDDPYLIYTAEEMAYLIRNYDNNENIYYKKFYKLMNDLDMSSTQWTFGSATSDRKSFRSHFNGNGHKISNVEVTLVDAQGECHYGLFPQLGGDPNFRSTIENLEVENIHFVRSTGDATGTFNFRIGGLVGQMESNSCISNCLVRGFAVNDYGKEINLHPSSKISACPLVGEVLNYFGTDRNYYEEARINIEHCYGHGTADLSHFHGTESQLFSLETQGTKQKEGYTFNKIVWHEINETDMSFSSISVAVSPVISGERFEYEGTFTKRKGHTYSYRWTLDDEKIGNSRTATVVVEPKPYIQRLSLTVLDNGVDAGSSAVLIEPDVFNLNVVDNPKPKGKKIKGAHCVMAQITSQNDVPIAEGDFLFSWQDMTDGFKEVCNTIAFNGALDGHSYLLLATHKDNKNARFSVIKSYTNPIYVCHHGINGLEASTYSEKGMPYKAGNDRNNGLTPQTAVRTLRRAYELLKTKEQGGTVGNNIIVIMGDYADFCFTEYLDSKCTRPNPDYFVKDRPATITGAYDDFKSGRILFSGLSIKMAAETRFEAINLNGSSFDNTNITDQTKVFACGNDLTMGYGVFVSGYKMMDYTLGLEEGVLAPAVTIYGGILNNNDPDYIWPENTVTILSGNYGRVIAGDGYTLQMERTGNISGTPKHPIRTHIVCNTSNYYNPYHNQYDIALLIGGQADGTVFADTHIDIKGGSKVGRIVGGNVGFGRLVKGRPADSFFGRTNVTVSGGSVTEVYGANLGRYGHILYASETEHDSCMTYFYGQAYLNLIGGTIYNTVYGGGAACVTGFQYDKNHHTFDPHIPYMKNGKVVFGTYDEAVGKMPIVQLSNDETVDLSQTELHVNIGGDVHIMGSLYGGSISFSSLLPTHQAGSQTGNIYADTYINMDGGLIDGYIFGGCRSNLAYFDNSDHSNYPLFKGIQTDKMYFSHMAQMYGHSHVTMTGGELKGIIYGGGEGPYYRETSITDHTNAVVMLGATYGTTQVNIGGDAVINDYIFGGGNYAHILRTGDEEKPENAGNVEININGGKMLAAVFGGGHGNKETEDALSIYPRVAGDVRVNLTGGQFIYNPKKARYVSRRFYGVCVGGISSSIVRGDTWLNVEHNPFPEDLLHNPALRPEEDLVLCAGGYATDCTVVGKAHTIVNCQNSTKIERIYMGGIYGPVGSTEAQVYCGNVERLYGTGRYGVVNSGNIDINIGTVNDIDNLNEAINVDNIFQGPDNSKTKIKINGGYVLNILQAE